MESNSKNKENQRAFNVVKDAILDSACSYQDQKRIALDRWTGMIAVKLLIHRGHKAKCERNELQRSAKDALFSNDLEFFAGVASKKDIEKGLEAAKNVLLSAQYKVLDLLLPEFCEDLPDSVQSKNQIIDFVIMKIDAKDIVDASLGVLEAVKTALVLLKEEGDHGR